MTDLPANESNETPMSAEDKMSLFAHNLSEASRLAKELGVAAADPENPFDNIVFAPPTGAMQTASDSPAAHQARESIKAAAIEIGLPAAIATVFDQVKELVGFAAL